MANRIIEAGGVAPPLGPYSMAIASDGPGTWLHVAGQIGVDPDGALPDGFEAQARQAWSNLLAVLSAADMQVEHIVKVNAFVTRSEDLPTLSAVRTAFIGAARPASTVLVVQALARPEWRVEVEAVAFRPAAG